MVTSWIDREGNIHKGDNHFEIVEILFPPEAQQEKIAMLWNKHYHKA